MGTNETEHTAIVHDYDLEVARLDYEICELRRKKAQKLYEKAFFESTSALPPTNLVTQRRDHA